VYAFVIDGYVSINDVALERRDSLGVWGGEVITVSTDDTEDAEVLFVETAP
jgi:redox-sensitive bicupin YhaK (pirin superfamily)